MADRAKHAHGSRSNLNAALANKIVDEFDVLFLSGENENPAIGWVDKNGTPILISPADEVSRLETQVEEVLATKANVAEVEASLATKVDAAVVDEKIDQAVSSTVTTAKAYTDGKVEAALNEHLVKKYEISCTPEGTLVNYGEKEIRVMCPVNTKWVKQTVGGTGNANMYYMAFKAYAPEGAVSFKEGDKGVIIDEMFDFTGDFAGTDEYGRNYSICWLALASYDAATDEWSYFGKNSSIEKYIGWTYVVEWYNAEGVIIAYDSIRINLSNESCHSVIEPYYLADMMKEVEIKIAESAVIEIVEF